MVFDRLVCKTGNEFVGEADALGGCEWVAMRIAVVFVESLP